MILGEVHDNAAHHIVQAEIVAELQPTALVFEMFGPEAAANLNDKADETADGLADALGWENLGWPDFSLYYPIFEAASDMPVFGAALQTDQVRQAVSDGAAAVFGAEAGRYGLGAPLAETEQAERESLQDDAHCNALPPKLLPGMVEAQRLRDAAFARTALEALAQHGPPVVVITGTGHARRDWGIPAAIAKAAPEVTVASLGQGEHGGPTPPDGRFDIFTTSPPADRPDPCAAFH